MTRRLATICLTVLLIGISSPPIQAQDTERRRATLKGISALSVLVEDLPNGAKVLGLTRESIQTDVELKLRLAGIRVVTDQEDLSLPGMPSLSVVVNLTESAKSASIDIELHQNAFLERNGQLVVDVTTWGTGGLAANPTAQDIRNYIKDHVDKFLNAWLSVNPKK
jgi:hypothetical protein